jgi:hypothetical protein
MLDLSAVSVSYNGCELLRQTLQSVFRVTRGLNFEYIVIDNASHDDSVAMVRAEFPHVKLIANTENIGAAGAYNQGIQHSQGRYIVFLNPDTVLKEDVLAGLVQFMEAHPRAGAASPRVLWPDGHFQLGVGGFAAGPLSFLGHYFFLDRLSGGRVPAFLIQQRLYQSGPVQIDWLGAVCMIVRRAAFEEVGLFDERFFVYAEDTEWCDRARRAGWEIYYCPQFSVYHYLGGSSKADPDEVPQSTLWLKSLDLYLRLRYGLKKTIILESIAALGMMMRLGLYAGAYLLHRRPHDRGKIQQMRKYSGALWHYIRNNLRPQATLASFS